MDPVFFNSLWLFLDVVWFILLYIFWVPEGILTSHWWNVVCDLWWTDKENNVQKYRLYKLFSKQWVILIMLGFSLQLLSNFI